MTCNVFKTAPWTLRQALTDLNGEPPDPRDVPLHKGMGNAQRERELRRIEREWDEVQPGGETVFMCGDLIIPVCRCQHAADYLCDYPIGEGKTCDLPLCESCRHPVGEELDLCELHFAEFKGKARVKVINPWPPPRGGVR